MANDVSTFAYDIDSVFCLIGIALGALDSKLSVSLQLSLIQALD